MKINNELYLRNYNSFINKYPKFQDILDSDNSIMNLEVIGNGRDKGLILRFNGDDRIFLNSPENPVQEASKIVDDLELEPGEIRILIGMGLGYLPLEILKENIPFLNLIVIEPYSDIFKKAMYCIDLTTLFESDNIHFIVGEQINLFNIIASNQLDASLMKKGSRISYYEPERRISAEIFDRISLSIREQISKIRTQIGTNLNVGPVFFRNSMNNLTSTIKSVCLGNLKNVFKGKTAIVSGAGPSLSGCIETIKENRDNFVVFSVDSALPVFLKNEITPDLVGAVDFHSISFDKYRDFLEETEDIPILYHNSCASMIVKPYKSQIKFFVSNKIGIFSKIGDKWGEWIEPPQMGAVSHLMIFAAIYAGCNPIIFTGLDLGYTGFKSYADGTSMGSVIDVASLVWGKNYEGEQIATIPQMQIQRKIIEEYVDLYSDVQFYNTGDGIKIEGAPKISLSDFISDNKFSKVNALSLIKEVFYKSPKPSLEEVSNFLENEIRELSKLSSVCKKGKEKVLKAKASLLGNKKDCDSKLKALIKFYDDNYKTPEVLFVCSQLFARDEMELRGEELDLNIETHGLGHDKKVLKEVDFIGRWFDVRLKSINELKSLYLKISSRLKSEFKLISKIDRTDSEKDKSRLYSELGYVYLGYGDLSDAEKSFREAVGLNSNNAKALSGLAQVSSSIKKHKEAVELFKNALSIAPGNKEFELLLKKEIHSVNDSFEQALAYYIEGIKDPGLNNRFHWAIRMCNDILKNYPENGKAKDLKANCEKYLKEREDENREILEILDKNLNDALDEIEELRKVDVDRALKLLNIFIRQGRKSAQLLELMGLCYMDKNDYSSAKKYLIQSSSTSDDAYSPYVHLAVIAANEKKYDEAVSYLEDADTLAKGKLSEIKKILGDLYMDLGHFDKAERCYLDGLDANITDLSLLYSLMDLYKLTGRKDNELKIKNIILKFDS